MVWVRVDDHIDEHPKLAAVGPLGLALHVAGLAYSNRNLTDGFVPRAAARTLLDWRFPATDGPDFTVSITWQGELAGGGHDVESETVIHALLDAGLWQIEDGGYRIHDYLDYQPSRTDVLADREANANRVRRHRERRRNGVGNGHVMVAPNPYPNPDTPLSPSETSPHQFEQFWQVYPRKVGKRRAETAWRSAVGRADAGVIHEGAVRLAADPNLPERQFIPHPVTWLGRDGWLDEPLPPRASRNGRVDQAADIASGRWRQEART